LKIGLRDIQSKHSDDREVYEQLLEGGERLREGLTEMRIRRLITEWERLWMDKGRAGG